MRAQLKFVSSNQKHYRDLGSDVSSVWNFCTRSSKDISRENQCLAGSVAKCRLFAQAIRLREMSFL